MRNNPVNKSFISKDLLKLKKIFGKSIALKKASVKGQVIKKRKYYNEKPAIGFGISELKKVVGKVAKKNLSSKRIIRKSDIE